MVHRRVVHRCDVHPREVVRPCADLLVPADVDIVGRVVVAAAASLVPRDLVNGGRPREQVFFDWRGPAGRVRLAVRGRPASRGISSRDSSSRGTPSRGISLRRTSSRGSTSLRRSSRTGRRGLRREGRSSGCRRSDSKGPCQRRPAARSGLFRLARACRASTTCCSWTTCVERYILARWFFEGCTIAWYILATYILAR